MKSCVLSFGFKPCISFMDSFTIFRPRCFSNHEDVTIRREFFDLLSTYMYDVEGKIPQLEYLHGFISILQEEDGCSNKQVSMLLAYTLRESPLQCCAAYQMIVCTHLNTFVISLKTLSIILVQTILTRNYYSNGRLCMNQLWIFGSTSMTCNFKLRGAR